MDGQRLFAAGLQYLLLLLSLSAREAFKAWVAEQSGDASARLLGRVSLNPLRHLELFGSIFLPGLLLGLSLVFPGGTVVFGWGRPVPILEKNLREPYRDGLRIAAAGPLCSFVLTCAGALGLAVVVGLSGPAAEEAALAALFQQWDKAGLAQFPLFFTLAAWTAINGLLTVFHLIPLPPLDGGRIALHLLPPDWAAKLAAIRPGGFMIGMSLALLFVGSLVIPLLLFVLSVLIHIAA